ncbi:hypothetical protein PENSPDRAFT_735936 [Peniophora sp. CONT]|nr:hypothetical protein PENSPDRAFT_735936 [Peniophora sp. CONT]
MFPLPTDLNARSNFTDDQTPPSGLQAGHSGAHERHEHCPDSLTCLSDTRGCPPYQLALITRATILGSPERRLSLGDIYTTIQKKYPYFQTGVAERTMKQEVEFELSIHDMFRRHKAVSDGDWLWKVDLNVSILPLEVDISINQTSRVKAEPWDATLWQRPACPPDRFCSLSESLASPSSPHLSESLAASGSKSADSSTKIPDSTPFTQGHTVDGFARAYGTFSSAILGDRGNQLLLENGSHPRHSGCPNALTCLEDGTEEPVYTVPVMVRCAILSAEKSKLSTHQICETLKAKYPYFRSRDTERKLNVRSLGSHGATLAYTFVAEGRTKELIEVSSIREDPREVSQHCVSRQRHCTTSLGIVLDGGSFYQGSDDLYTQPMRCSSSTRGVAGGRVAGDWVDVVAC